jgi:hypothetical protein
MNDEEMRRGWKALADYLKISESKARRMKGELTACGAVFFMRVGKPPRRRLSFWPSEIRKWARLKGSKGEIF